MEKEYLYIGFYYDTHNRFILKIGTTNDLERRRKEHDRNYKSAKIYQMPENGKFSYIFAKKYGKYNTLRFEDKTRKLWQAMEIGKFIRNDRFILQELPNSLYINIHKLHEIPLY